MPLLSNSDIEKLIELRDMIFSARGDVRVEKGKLYFGKPRAAATISIAPPPGGLSFVPITNATGAGKYIVKLNPVGTGTTIDPATDLVNAELGSAGSGADCLMLNGAETQESTGSETGETHGLTLNKVYPGAYPTGDTDSSGRAVYRCYIIELCETEE